MLSNANGKKISSAKYFNGLKSESLYELSDTSQYDIIQFDKLNSFANTKNSEQIFLKRKQLLRSSIEKSMLNQYLIKFRGTIYIPLSHGNHFLIGKFQMIKYF